MHRIAHEGSEYQRHDAVRPCRSHADRIRHMQLRGRSRIGRCGTGPSTTDIAAISVDHDGGARCSRAARSRHHGSSLQPTPESSRQATTRRSSCRSFPMTASCSICPARWGSRIFGLCIARLMLDNFPHQGVLDHADARHGAICSSTARMTSTAPSSGTTSPRSGAGARPGGLS